MTVSAVQAAWKTYVFDKAAIVDISSRALAYEHGATSEKELSAIRVGQRINFWEYVVSVAHKYQEIGTTTPAENYLVEVRYSLEKDVSGASHTDCGEAAETLLETVRTSLGQTWQGTVDYWEFQNDPFGVVADEIAGVPVWRVVNRFQAFK